MSETNPGVERVHLPLSSPPTNHGNTTAAWVLVVLVVLGALMASLAMVFAVVPLVWVGAGVIVSGLVAGRVLKMLGLGQPTGPTTRRAEIGA